MWLLPLSSNRKTRGLFERSVCKRTFQSKHHQKVSHFFNFMFIDEIFIPVSDSRLEREFVLKP